MARTTYVGDSLGVGTTQYLRKPNSNTRVGRTSAEALEVLRRKLRDKDKAVVFDVGTNDPSAAELKRNLRRAERLIGDRRLVLATVNGPKAHEKNQAIRQFASRHGNVEVVEWKRRGITGPDGIHSTPDGYRLRAKLVRRAIRSGQSPRKRPHSSPTRVRSAGVNVSGNVRLTPGGGLPSLRDLLLVGPRRG